MFKNLDDYVRQGVPLAIDECDQALNSREAQVAVVAVLVAAAHSNSEFNAEELSRLMGTVFREFELRETDGAELLELAEFMLRDQGRLRKFLELLSSKLPSGQCEYLMALVWKVLIADGRLDKCEAVFAAEVRRALGLTLEQGVRAQQLAQQMTAQVLLDATAKFSE